MEYKIHNKGLYEYDAVSRLRDSQLGAKISDVVNTSKKESCRLHQEKKNQYF